MKNRYKSKRQNVFGYHLMLDLYDCDPSKPADLQFCYSYLDRLPSLLKIEKLSPPFIIFTDDKKYPDKAGLSGWIPFVDLKAQIFSGASIHTLCPTRFISVDIYSTRKFNREKVREFTKKAFGSHKLEEQFLIRGI